MSKSTPFASLRIMQSRSKIVHRPLKITNMNPLVRLPENSVTHPASPSISHHNQPRSSQTIKHHPKYPTQLSASPNPARFGFPAHGHPPCHGTARITQTIFAEPPDLQSKKQVEFETTHHQNATFH
jgi:hypothetical protein